MTATSREIVRFDVEKQRVHFMAPLLQFSGAGYESDTFWA
ncbi:hypothetical protein Cenrod_1976 [Candidatus Symbiobacter mobilis CR]|uniref:Uncharacterized protein n=1 Tax=Candidatus Symbiobacter mobilis CR TaxID=946483 RepID=U5N9Q6_9BURK|nr:hypothetical protein Cenrod_1976 [Candidatus Symbiobacter mobilis CR]